LENSQIGQKLCRIKLPAPQKGSFLNLCRQPFRPFTIPDLLSFFAGEILNHPKTLPFSGMVAI